MVGTQQRDVKRAQKESLLLREISQFFLQITLDFPELTSLSVSRVKLSPDKGACTVYFYAPGGLAEYEQKRPSLVLFKATLRKAISQSIPGRYTPELIFKFDDQFEKQQRLETLLNKIKDEEPSNAS